MKSELTDDEKQKLGKELQEAEQAVRDVGQQIVDQGLLKEAPPSLTESIRRKVAESQNDKKQ